MIRVLHYIPGFEYGGIESLIMNIYKKIDKEKMQFDFLVEKPIPENIANECINTSKNITKARIILTPCRIFFT